jgi:hypothetical protein
MSAQAEGEYAEALKLLSSIRLEIDPMTVVIFYITLV